MAIGYESLVFHDATEEELRILVETVARQLVERRGWTRIAGDLPSSTGLRAPRSWHSWGERVTIAVEEKSIRIVSEGRNAVALIDGGKNRSNVELVRQGIRRAISGDGPASE